MRRFVSNDDSIQAGSREKIRELLCFFSYFPLLLSFFSLSRFSSFSSFPFSLEDNEPPTVPANDGHLKFNLAN